MKHNNKFDSLHCFLSCTSALLFLGLFCDYFDNHTFNIKQEKKGSCCVEVFLGEEPEINKQKPEIKKSKLYKVNQKLDISKKEFDCLAKNIYWEAMLEPVIGQIGVATTTNNRVNSGRWGNGFCDVVFAPKQFSWTNLPELKKATPKGKYWERAKKSARLFINGTRVTLLERVQHYHAVYVKPKWAKQMNKKTIIGNHIFYASNGN